MLVPGLEEQHKSQTQVSYHCLLGRQRFCVVHGDPPEGVMKKPPVTYRTRASLASLALQQKNDAAKISTVFIG